MVRHQTSTDLQIKFHFYGGLIGGGAEVMGRELKTHGRWKNGDETDCSLLTVFYMGLLPWVLPKNMGGGHDPVE